MPLRSLRQAPKGIRGWGGGGLTAADMGIDGGNLDEMAGPGSGSGRWMTRHNKVFSALALEGWYRSGKRWIKVLTLGGMLETTVDQSTKEFGLQEEILEA